MPDPNRCPDCDAVLDGAATCPSCGLPLRGPTAVRLWQVSIQLERLARERESLLRSLRSGETPPPVTGAPVPQAPQMQRPNVWREAPAPKPRKEWTPQRVQNVLLGTGALLLVVAAIAFTAFAWGRLPIPARAAVMLGITGIAGWSARWVYKRGLTASAEAIALVAVLFGVVDAYAARRANLGGLAGTDGPTYWSVATGVLAAASAAFARVVPVRSLRWFALAAAQLPLAITAARLDGVDVTLAERGGYFVVQAALLAAGARYLGGTAWGARWCALGNWVLGGALAVTTAYGSADRGEVLVAAAILLAAGAVALLWPGDRALPAAATTLLATVAALAPAALAMNRDDLPAAVAAAALLTVVAAAQVPRAWRVGPLGIGLGTTGVALAMVLPAVAQAVLLPFSWAAEAWTIDGDPGSRTALTPYGDEWAGTLVTLAVVAVAALAVAVAGAALRRPARWWVVGFAGTAVLMVPLAFAWTFRGALTWYVVAGLAGLVASFVLKRAVVAFPTTIVLAVATGWALADEGATLVVLLAVTVAYALYAGLLPAAREWAAAIAASGAVGYAAAVAAFRDAPVDRVGFSVALAAVGLLAADEVLGRRVRSVAVVAAVAYPVGLLLAGIDTGWLAWTLGIGTVAAALAALRPERRLLVPVAASLGIACVGAAAYAFGTPDPRVAFFVALACAAAVGAGAWLRGQAGDLTECVAALGYAVALLLCVEDLGWLSWVLAVGGVTAFANGMRRDRRALNWVATALLTAWTWDRLWLEDVKVPEAYAAPIAVLLLGLGHLRRLREPETSSWAAYGRGLVAAFLPTCLLIFDDPGLTRPVLLAIGGLVVLLAGLRERLQAPLTVGAVALALDALNELAPVAARLPRWATIGAVGLAVIAVGVTYEDRRRDVERLRDAYDSLT